MCLLADILTNFNGWKNSLDDVSSNSSNINPLDIKVQTMQLPTGTVCYIQKVLSLPTIIGASSRKNLSSGFETG